jgi:hypothetical protein
MVNFMEFKVGAKVFYFVDQAIAKPELRRKKGSQLYDRFMCKIVRTYHPEQSLSAIDIEKHFGVSPGTEKFNEFYIGGNKRQMKTIIQSQKTGECFFIEERWWDNIMGDTRYLEIIPNSVAFILGDD